MHIFPFFLFFLTRFQDVAAGYWKQGGGGNHPTIRQVPPRQPCASTFPGLWSGRQRNNARIVSYLHHWVSVNVSVALTPSM